MAEALTETGLKLWWCRYTLGLTQKAFAEKLGVNPRLLRDWESGKKQVSYQSWVKYFRDRKP